MGERYLTRRMRSLAKLFGIKPAPTGNRIPAAVPPKTPKPSSPISEYMRARLCAVKLEMLSVRQLLDTRFPNTFWHRRIGAHEFFSSDPDLAAMLAMYCRC